MDAPTKITYFELTIDAEQKVFGLDVSVYDMFVMKVG